MKESLLLSAHPAHPRINSRRRYNPGNWPSTTTFEFLAGTGEEEAELRAFIRMAQQVEILAIMLDVQIGFRSGT